MAIPPSPPSASSTPPSTLLLRPLNTLDATLQTLLQTLQTSQTYSSLSQHTSTLLATDTDLTAALDILRLHQERVRQIIEVKAEIAALESRVRGVVRGVEEFGNVVGSFGETSTSLDPDSDSDDSEDETQTSAQASSTNDVNYTTLLDFARRIGKYNAQAAHDITNATNNTTTTTSTQPPSQTQNATTLPEQDKTWLNEPSLLTREATFAPFPSQDRIRAGLLGRIQGLAEEKASSGTSTSTAAKPDLEALREAEVERMMEEWENGGVAGSLGEVVAETVMEQQRAPVQAQVQASVPAQQQQQQSAGPAPPQQSHGMLDLDLYDPDDDE